MTPNKKISPERARERAFFQYHTALERGDFETVARVLKQAERDPILWQMIDDLNGFDEGTSVSAPRSTGRAPQNDKHITQVITVRDPAANGQTPKPDHSQEDTDMLYYKTAVTTLAENPKTLHPVAKRFITLAAAILIVTLVGALLIAMLGKGRQDDNPSFLAAATEEAYAPVLDPANFVDTVDNPYFPLTPGTLFTYEGQDRGSVEHVETYVTNERKQILGISCVVVRDRAWVDGTLAEDTLDWYAQDKDGNVWYLGEATQTFENGKVVSTEGSWEAGVDGAQPGIIMQAHPQPGDSYRQEYYAGHAEDMAEVLSLTENISMPYGTFDQGNVLMTNEWTALEPGIASHKYYAPGIGTVLEQDAKDPSIRLELKSVEMEDDEISDSPDDQNDEAESTSVPVPDMTAEAAQQAATP